MSDNLPSNQTISQSNNSLNLEKLVCVFVSALGIPADEAESAVFKETKGWDSVGHVNLMNAVEETFDVSLDADDILDFKSFNTGREILKKYGIEF